jgi:hypothetical protein
MAMMGIGRDGLTFDRRLVPIDQEMVMAGRFLGSARRRHAHALQAEADHHGTADALAVLGGDEVDRSARGRRRARQLGRSDRGDQHEAQQGYDSMSAMHGTLSRALVSDGTNARSA